MNTKIKIIAVLCLLLGFASTALAMDAYGLNTVAGYSTVLRTSQGNPNSDVVFVVRKPNGSLVEVDAKASSGGVAIKEFSDYYTHQAGEYGVSVKGDSSFRPFIVYPGHVSDVNSKITPTDQVVHSLSEKGTLTVKLLDKYNNPVEGHVLKIISSSSNSKVDYLSSGATGKTNSKGEISFSLSSPVAGKVTYSVYDATEDVILSSRANVVYFSSNSSVIGSQMYTSVLGAVGNASGAIDEFKFKNFPASVKVGDSVSLTLAALDAADQVVSNYDGTVRFAVSGGNSGYVSLPGDYTFKLEDQGEHTFSLSFSFQKAGTYDIEVRDLDNPSASGTISVIVGDGASGTSGNSNSALKIDNPSNGGVYSNNVQVISGTAVAGSNLRVFDNNIKIGELVVDSSGTFSFTSSLLQDGAHKIYVATVNEVGTIITTSSTVDFTIDTNPAAIGQVVIEPIGAVNPGEIIKIKLLTDDVLDRAELTLNNNVLELTKNSDGIYEVSVPAPIEFGDYKLKFNLVDELGNESSFEDAAVLKVGKMGTVASQAPGKVTNLVVTPSDSKVTLNWQTPSTGAEDITNYRVFYGSSPNQLTSAVDTFTTATTWYIPALTNGQTYYFAVAAVNSKSEISESFDKILAATPNPAVIDVPSVNFENGVDGADVLKEIPKDPAEAGPEVLWLVLLAALGGIFYSEATKRRLKLKRAISKDC